MSLGNSISEFIKIQERFHIFWWQLSIKFSLILLVLDGFFTRGLYVTFTYFFSIQYFFFHDFWEIYFQMHKSIGTGPFFWLIFSVGLFLFLLLVHGFHLRGQFITCTYFFPFSYKLFLWIWAILLTNSKTYKNGFIFFDGISLLYFLLFLLPVDGFNTREYLEPAHIFILSSMALSHEFGEFY